MITSSTNLNRIFENDVWNAFNALGHDYLVFLHSNNVGQAQFIPPKNSEFADFIGRKEAIDYLLEHGFAKQRNDNLLKRHGVEKAPQYMLTEKGRALFEELSIFEGFENERKFIERVQPKRKS